MDVSLYLFPFMKALLFSCGGIVILLWLRRRGAEKDIRTTSRHTHAPGVGRWGGVAVIVAFVAIVVTDNHLVMTPPLWGMVGASLLILLVGLWDDARELSWKTQAAFQFLVAATVFWCGVRFLSIPYPFGGTFFLDAPQFVWLSFGLSVIWVMMVMNAVNWADGIDGWCGGLALIGFVTVFLLSLKPEVNQPPVGIIAAALAGATAGFLIFNVYPAKILAGTSGAWFFGFMLASLAIFAGTKIATALLVLALPVLDAGWVVWERWRSQASIFQADARHLHYRLKALGWSQRRIIFFLYAVTGVIAALALNTRTWGKLMTSIVVAVLTLLLLLWLGRRTKRLAVW